ncbi:MAG: bifunctional diaminohydroxyphosphoribosylaminopyrimidine deaminase/5-amino-6-(5-phosphoribosylamino)uracil reductase RibD [Leptothrix ochracea]|uniref:bifunctional diaminohydroxyphosphoribosylaminopyrimidine deaminase/5-amino-6-(5-phosphoribosylamino)uracil reductase RibD n=1 Tax=Leptothrix ochracea TaxID=735331 RepID=UPI0034E2DAC6
MQRALALAQHAIGLSDPNPRVGCVLVRQDGQTLGEGHTQQAGGPHAEVMALRDARQQGHNPRGATAYVTLEPCAHHGRTPPCCDALIEAGVGRVVVAIRDPNPLVAGQGLARLRAAGITVDVGLLAHEARELNIGFFSRMVRQRPWVRLKVAASLDGRTALPDGRSQWITSAAARTDGHAWRKRAGAVLTGIGTVLADDPRLDVRLVATTHQPLRVVVDGGLRLEPQARILAAPGRVRIYTGVGDPLRLAHARSFLGETQEPERIRIVSLPARRSEEQGRDPMSEHVDLAALLDDLAGEGINEVHVEAGAGLNGAWVRAGLVDEYLVYLAPKLIGAGLPMAALGPLESLAHAPLLEWVEVSPVAGGPDLRLRARPL